MAFIAWFIFITVLYFCSNAFPPPNITRIVTPNDITKYSANYDYWCTGNCNNPVQTATHPGIIIMGGSTDVDDAIIQQINWSGCGDFLVLRASGSDGYNSYIYGLGCANSVTSILIHNKAGANEDFVIDTINDAEAIFFAGGDQGKYIKDWMGTQLQSAVQNSVDRNVPIGGTSAGAMIQPWDIYTADQGTVYSDEALEDPYNRYMTFSSFFIVQKSNILVDTIIDTHFEQRDRFGRLLGFVARMRTDNNGANVKGIGINERTAMLIDLETNIGVTVGSSDVFLIIPGNDNNPTVCAPGQDLVYIDVPVQKLESSYDDTFNFQTWTGGHPGLNYNVSASNGQLDKDPYKP